MDTIQPPLFTSGYTAVNGINMYYEIYGEGKPLVLIHGGGSTIQTSFAKVIPLFCQARKVIAVELQAHGRTGDRPAPESFEQDADDVAGLLQNIGITRADILGFSNGGSTTMQLAIRHPQLVNKIIVASAFYKREGMYPWFWEFMPNATLANMPAELQEAYKQVAARPEELETMHNKDRDRMLNFKDWSDDALKSIAAPALFITADKDVMTPEHTVAMHRLVANSRLAILPGGHGEYLGEITFKNPGKLPEITVALVNEFLEG
ncbi:MAG TPA: alpha/beta hydrolase [Chitinophagaceae bacterium]|nr:alpha/beta hydrolase [Chitinophagaceae bacterium]